MSQQEILGQSQKPSKNSNYRKEPQVMDQVMKEQLQGRIQYNKDQIQRFDEIVKLITGSNNRVLGQQGFHDRQGPAQTRSPQERPRLDTLQPNQGIQNAD